MAINIEDIRLRFTAEDEEGKEALQEFAALLTAVGQQDAEPEVDVDGVARASLDLGKLLALLKTVDGQTATAYIRTNTEEGQRAARLFRETIEGLTELEAEVHVTAEADVAAIAEAEGEVNRLRRRLSRQQKNLAKFVASDQRSVAGERERTKRVEQTNRELSEARNKLQELRNEASRGIEVKMDTLSARAALDLIRRRLRDLEKVVASPQVLLEKNQAERAAAEIHAALLEVSRLTARTKVDIHDEEFQTKVRNINNHLKRLDATLVRPAVNLDDGGAPESIAHISTVLEFLGASEANPNIDVDPTGPLANIAAVKAAMDALERTGDVSIDIETKGSMERLGGISGIFTHAINRAQEAAAGFGARLGGVRTSVFGFAFALNAASLAVIGLLGAIALLLVGGLAALASSAVLAAGAIGALAVALGAALGPGILLAIAAATRLTAVFKVLQSQEAARLQQQQQAISGESQRAASMDQLANAAEQLERAQRSLGEATAAAYREMEDAAEAATDAVRRLEGAQLDLEGARIGVERAKLELREFRNEVGLADEDMEGLFQRSFDLDFRADPGRVLRLLGDDAQKLDEDQRIRLLELIHNVRQAKFREKEATDGLSDSERELSRAQELNNEFREKGIRASGRYVAALEAVEDAQKAVARAHQDRGMLAAQARMLAMTQELSREERKLLRLLNSVKDAFKDAFGPATDILFQAFADVLKGLGPMLRAIAPALEAMAGALGLSIRVLAKQLGSPKMINNFNKLAGAFIKMTGPITRGISALFEIFVNLALAVMPYLIDFAERFADKLTEWAAWTRDGDKLETVIRIIMEHLEIWLDIAYQLARVFVGFLAAAEPIAKDMAKWLLEALTNLADFLADPKKREEFRDWLRDAADATMDMAGALGSLVVLLARLGSIANHIIEPFDTVLQHLERSIGQAQWMFRKMQEISSRIWNKIGDVVFGNLTEAFEVAWDFIRVFYQLGKDIFNALLDGMKAAWEEGNKGFFEILEQIAKGPSIVFKIRSPSKLFRGYGEDLMKGFFEGIESQKGALSALVENTLAVPTIAAVPTSLPSPVITPAVVASGGSRTTNVYPQIHTPPGTAPDAEALAAQLQRRLRRIGR